MKFWTLILMFLSLDLFGQSKEKQLAQNISELKTLIGAWTVEAREIDPAGKEKATQGDFNISWALDSTYVRIAAKLEEVVTHKKRAFECLITYNPDSSRFELSYFYSRQAFRVFETGVLNKTSKTLTTRTTLKFSDGSKYYIRTELDFHNLNQLNWNSWARTKPEQKEFPDWIAVLKRKG